MQFLQHFLFKTLQNENLLLVKKAMDLIVSMFQKRIWFCFSFSYITSLPVFHPHFISFSRQTSSTVTVLSELCFIRSSKIRGMALLFFLGAHPMQLRPSKSKKGGFVEDESSDDDLISKDGSVNETKHKQLLQDLKKKGQYGNKKATKREKAKLKAKIHRAQQRDDDEEQTLTKKDMFQLKKKAGQGKARNKRKYEQAVKQVR